MLETTVVVIGGGATGMGTLRDLCMPPTSSSKSSISFTLCWNRAASPTAPAPVFTACSTAGVVMLSMTTNPRASALKKT